MAASKTRNPEAVGQRSGGQESDALMSYLAMVKDQCKPPVYSAFISLINAYHGNMLAVDALLGELFSLFYPRVFLLSGIKPLVDKSYHPRVDELCDKITRSSNSTTSSSSSSSDGSGDTGGVSGDISLPPSLGCSLDSSDRSVAFRVAMDVHSATPKPEIGGGGGGGNHAIPGDRKSESTPLLSSVDSGGKDKRQSIRGGVKAGGSTGLKTNRSLVTSTSKSSSRRKAGDCYSTGRGRRNNDHDHDHDQELGTKPTKLCSPNTGALHSDKGDIGDLLSDIEPTVDPALLDFMMRGNSPAVASLAIQMNPPPLTLQQEKQQQQHHWSTPSITLDQALLGGTDHAMPSAGLSPAKRGGGGETDESSVELSSSETNMPPTYHRSGSASSLTELACRGEGGTRAMAFKKSSDPSQNRHRCNVALSTSPSSIAFPTAPRHSSVSVGRQGTFSGTGTSTPNSSENPNLEDEVFPGSGKRVWDERSGVGARLSSSAPSASFFFPSAASASAAENGMAALQPHIKRRISTDAAANGIEEDHSPVQRNGRSDAAFSSYGISNGGSIDNDRGISNGGSNGSGLNVFGVLNSDSMNSDIAGVGSVRSMSLRQESPPTSRGEGGLSKSGNDLERLVMNVATKGMQQALQYGLRHTFSVILLKKDQEIAELKEEALRWAENDTRLRQLNQQLLNDNMQLRAAAGWETHTSSKSP